MKAVVRWAGAALGVVAFVVLVVIAWGTGLPLDHDVTCSASYDEPPIVTFDAVEDDANSPAWRTDVTRVLRTTEPDGTTNWAETDVHGTTMHYREAMTSRAEGKIVRRIDEPGAPFGGTWTYTIAPAPEGSILSVEESGTIYNPVFRFLARYAFGYTSRIRTYLSDLHAKFERRGAAPAISCTEPMFSSPK